MDLEARRGSVLHGSTQYAVSPVLVTVACDTSCAISELDSDQILPNGKRLRVVPLLFRGTRPTSSSHLAFSSTSNFVFLSKPWLPRPFENDQESP
ncbi:hypothetical protein FA15DRAFT_366086 [Coprinopsis marcescibilis]|uniref:Uncharacterized protein n=1 Tax=Coprinopsis marcescibilis TaxID=230819 RepID=A0A5C3KAD5_COPMA|nr:hypothetical protein FA15DRAFT_366086 [Coprinopsis marcescibilis]